jgi:hypothetical protein
MRHAHRLVLLLAALTALVLTAAAGVALTPAAHAAGAQNRVGAFIPRTQSLTRPAALESSCIRPGLIASTAGIAAGFCVAAEDLPEGASPALEGSPYSPREVSLRQSELRRQLGTGNLDPDSPIPDQGPGENLGGQANEGYSHSTGERNVSPGEEHSRTPKGAPYYGP